MSNHNTLDQDLAQDPKKKMVVYTAMLRDLEKKLRIPEIACYILGITNLFSGGIDGIPFGIGFLACGFFFRRKPFPVAIIAVLLAVPNILFMVFAVMSNEISYIRVIIISLVFLILIVGVVNANRFKKTKEELDELVKENYHLKRD